MIEESKPWYGDAVPYWAMSRERGIAIYWQKHRKLLTRSTRQRKLLEE